jgi:hypothetical protein
MKKSYVFQLVAVFSVVTWMSFGSIVAQAADFHSPRAAALSGAGRASPLLNDAIYFNPSFIGFLPSYSLAANFTRFTTDTVQTKGRNYNVSVQDGKSELFSAGAAYTLREDGSIAHVGLGKALDPRFGLGVGAKYFFNNTRLQSGADFNASSTIIFDQMLQMALVVDNIAEGPSSKQRANYREFAAGLKGNFDQMILVYFDPQYTPNRPTGKKLGFSAAAEIVVASDLFLRGGLHRDVKQPWINTPAQGFGLGVGWLAPKIALDYGYTRNSKPFVSSAHQFGMTVYF